MAVPVLRLFHPYVNSSLYSCGNVAYGFPSARHPDHIEMTKQLVLLHRHRINLDDTYFAFSAAWGLHPLHSGGMRLDYHCKYGVLFAHWHPMHHKEAVRISVACM